MVLLTFGTCFFVFFSKISICNWKCRNTFSCVVRQRCFSWRSNYLSPVLLVSDSSDVTFRPRDMIGLLSGRIRFSSLENVAKCGFHLVSVKCFDRVLMLFDGTFVSIFSLVALMVPKMCFGQENTRIIYLDRYMWKIVHVSERNWTPLSFYFALLVYLFQYCVKKDFKFCLSCFILKCFHVIRMLQNVLFIIFLAQLEIPA